MSGKPVSRKKLEEVLDHIEPNLLQLGNYGSDAVPALLEIFRDESVSSQVRAKIVYVLGFLPDVPPDIIREAAYAKDVRLRRSAAATVDNLAPEIASPILADLIVDTDSIVRHTAANHFPIPSRRLVMSTDSSTKKEGETGLSPATQCELGGPEIPATVINFRQGDVAEFHYYICRTTARARIFLVLHETQSQLLADAQSKKEIKMILPKLPPGRHLLYWGFQGAGLRWQSRADFLVNGICRFRHRKSSEGNDPVNRGFLLLEVIAGRTRKKLVKRSRGG